MSTLYPYQRIGAEFLAARQCGGIIDEAGLGKSAQAITAARLVKAQRIGVICPAVARVNWRREFSLWWPHGPEPMIESYDRIAASRALRQYWYSRHPDVLILDEAHYLKSPAALRTQAVYGRGLDGRRCVMSGAARVWLLSATLAPNSLLEYYTHLRALAPGLLTCGGKLLTAYDYLNRYAQWEATRFGPRVFGHKNEDELRTILRALFLRRTVEEVLPELPPWSWEHLTVDGGDAAVELLRMEESSSVVDSLRERVETEEDFACADAQLSALRRVIGLVKAPLVAAVLAEELTNHAYGKVVVFAHHHAVINKLHEVLSDFGPVQLTGKTSEAERNKLIDRFQADPRCRVFIGQLQACGACITLHAANRVVFCESSWVPQENYQAAKRCHRIGQKLPVFVRVFGLHGSLDDAVAAVCARKGRLLNQIRVED